MYQNICVVLRWLIGVVHGSTGTKQPEHRYNEERHWQMCSHTERFMSAWACYNAKQCSLWQYCLHYSILIRSNLTEINLEVQMYTMQNFTSTMVFEWKKASILQWKKECDVSHNRTPIHSRQNQQKKNIIKKNQKAAQITQNRLEAFIKKLYPICHLWQWRIFYI